MIAAAEGSPIRAVVLDLDDTLYLERDYVRSGYAAVARHLARAYPAAAGCDAWMWDRFSRGEAGGMFNALSDHLGLGLEPAQIAELVEVYRGHRPSIAPLPAAVSLLDDLAGRVKLALLSDGFMPAQPYKLDALGLAGRFRAICFTEMLGREHWKPARTGFELLSRQLIVPHEACAYVADNPAKDFVAPNALGWRTIQWRQEGQIHADAPAPPLGRPQCVARSARAVLAALGLVD